MNASDRLNTCKPRGSARVAILLAATGGRVSNTYATYLAQRDNPVKTGLIPHEAHTLHGACAKGAIRYQKVPHIGTETRSKLLREAAVRNIGQWAEA